MASSSKYDTVYDFIETDHLFRIDETDDKNCEYFSIHSQDPRTTCVGLLTYKRNKTIVFQIACQTHRNTIKLNYLLNLMK